MKSVILLIALVAAGCWLIAVSPLPDLLTLLLATPFAWVVIDLVQP